RLYAVRDVLFFFFSSRRRHTSSKRDWSSDVCSSDLARGAKVAAVSDEYGGIHNESGLDVKRLMEHVAQTGSVVGFDESDPISNEIGRASCRERRKDGTSGAAFSINKAQCSTWKQHRT